MFDKYDLIDNLITSMDELADARGAKRCAMIINIIQALSELKKGLQAEDRRAGETGTKEG